MLMVNQLIGFGAAASSSPVTISYIGTTTNTADTATYTFTDHAIGTASADRVVLVAVSLRSPTAGVSISSMTIGGVSATEIVEASTGANATSAIYGLLVTSGTTATIVVTPSATGQRCQVSVYAMTGNGGSTTAHATATDTTAPSSTTIDIPINGSAVGISYAVDSGAVGAATWAGLTEDNDATLENTSNAYSAAHLDSTGGATGLSIGVTWANGTPDGAEAFCAASFSPV